MESYRRECYEEVTVVTRIKRILHDGCRVAAASSNESPFENLRIFSKYLPDVLGTMTAPILREEREDSFHGLADGPVSEEQHTLRI